MPKQKPGKSKQDVGTPVEFIAACARRFGLIDWDLAAHAENTKCGASYYGPGSEHCGDSLSVNWAERHPTGVLWLNPEFRDIEPWAKKCAVESTRRHGMILMLTPASVGTEWFADYVAGKAMVLGLRPRLTFVGASDPYPKDLSLAVYSSGLHGVDTWRWK
jgi:hypothetical protein